MTGRAFSAVFPTFSAVFMATLSVFFAVFSKLKSPGGRDGADKLSANKFSAEKASVALRRAGSAWI